MTVGCQEDATVSESASAVKLGQHHFLLRRLHSLTGIVPIGVFLIAHLVTNSSVVWGGFALHGDGGLGPDASIFSRGIAYFQKEVAWINTQIPHLLLIEITLWVSIAFHSILGVYYARTGKSNTAHYAYQDNWRYSLQRWSGYVGILFIFYHVATLRWGWTWLVPGGADWGYNAATSTLVAAMRGSTEGYTPVGVIVSLGYFLGVSLLVFHFANGLWTAAITWGLTISAKAQKRWGLVCAGLGVGLMAMAWASLIAFAFGVDIQEAERIEHILKDGGGHSVVVPADATASENSMPDAN
jgi:succinate dehydrogenase / fumarate reductase, cytochrome b subunit